LGTFLAFLKVSSVSFDGKKMSAFGDEMVRQSEGWWKRQMDGHEAGHNDCKCIT
jgi:hypothetical protein